MMEHFYETIQGWFGSKPAYDAIVARMPIDRPSTVVELGLWLGCSTAYLGVEIVNSGKPITLICVDHFKGSPELMGNSAIHTLEIDFRRNLSTVAQALGDRFRLIIGDSANSADMFLDDSVDVVWIDAAHEYQAVMSDIAAWSNKLKKSGIMAGDDFGRDSVRSAVVDRFGKSCLTNENYWWIEVGSTVGEG